jgi:hypothetical protein
MPPPRLVTNNFLSCDCADLAPPFISCWARDSLPPTLCSASARAKIAIQRKNTRCAIQPPIALAPPHVGVPARSASIHRRATKTHACPAQLLCAPVAPLVERRHRRAERSRPTRAHASIAINWLYLLKRAQLQAARCDGVQARTGRYRACRCHAPDWGETASYARMHRQRAPVAPPVERRSPFAAASRSVSTPDDRARSKNRCAPGRKLVCAPALDARAGPLAIDLVNVRSLVKLT